MSKMRPKNPKTCKCAGKMRHKDKTGAVIHLKKLKNAQMSAYPFEYCGGWHVGHSRHEMKIQARLDQLLGPAD